MLLTRRLSRLSSRFVYLSRPGWQTPTARFFSQARLLRASQPDHGANSPTDGGADRTEPVDKEKPPLTMVQRLALELQAERDQNPSSREARDPWVVKTSIRDFQDELDADLLAARNVPVESNIREVSFDENPWASDSRLDKIEEISAIPPEYRERNSRFSEKEERSAWRDGQPAITSQRHRQREEPHRSDRILKHGQNTPMGGQSLAGAPHGVLLVPRQLSVVFSNPRMTSHAEVLDTISSCRMPEKQWKVWGIRMQTLVVLVTPSFATWLDDEVFMSKLVGAFTYLTPELPVIDVIAAVVDGIAPTPDVIRTTAEQKVAEGFSMIHGRSAHLTPNLWSDQSGRAPTPLSQPARLTFSEPPEASGNVTLPLANTLFVNGNPSTLLVTRWRHNGESYNKIRSERKSHQTIRSLARGKKLLPHLWIHATAITPARRISSGLGNIIRQLDFEEGTGPASRELEAAVNAYIETRKEEKSTLAVWALVIPAAILTTDRCKDFVRVSARTGIPIVSTDVGSWVCKGAKFCRVLSGGGGWGAKQGLLSLDPETAFKTTEDGDEPSFDWMSDSAQDQQDAALGSIAKAGDYIQFFIASKAKPTEDTPSGPTEIQPAKIKTGQMKYRDWISSTVFGTVPSTIDDMPLAEDAAVASEQKITLLAGHFGAVSESGIYINLPAQRNMASVQSKIDLPFSFALKEFQALKRDGRKWLLTSKEKEIALSRHSDLVLGSRD